MAVQPTYPGVYVQEVPSGVRTITGVSTSVTAFLGTAKRGPINRAVTITSYSDYERRFGGLTSTSELSFAVRQFFMNGGTQAIIVRIARAPVAAITSLWNSGPAAIPVLDVTALDEGSEGNLIEVRVNYQTSNPNSLFNLVIKYTSTDNPSDNATETFSNLSMNSSHARYVVEIVNSSSNLVHIHRTVADGVFAGLPAGQSISGDLPDVNNLVDMTHNQFRIIIDGGDPVTVQLLPGDVASGGLPGDRMDHLIGLLPTRIGTGVTCATNAAKNQIIITSTHTGENSRIEILPGLANDVAALLRLGLMFGGRETESVATLRPAEVPVHSSLTSGVLLAADIAAIAWPDPAAHQFRIGIDGTVPALVTIDNSPPGAGTPAQQMAQIASRIQNAVRSVRPNSPSFVNFTCRAIDVNGAGTDFRLVLEPGSRGRDSSITVSAEAGDTLAEALKLIVNATPDTATIFQAHNENLGGGSELPITDTSQYADFTGNQAERTGIFALEAVDIFNILCLPGIEDPGILMESEAYCRTRRAFLIVDPPVSSVRPDQMANVVSGTTLPKSDHAAVYYPRIMISNPLNGGALRTSAPCGTIAGLYARIDSSRGVWKAPAGTEANLNGVRRLEYLLTDAENGLLNPLGINCLRIFPDAGAVSWGSRTLAGSDQTGSEYKYVPVRRTALFIEESLYRGLKWVVFEPNDEPLWSQIRLNVGAFMHNLFRQGAFQGTAKQDAYFVKCDRETTTQNDINLGIVNVWVGFAPLKPAEFVILYLQQMTGQIQV